MSLITSEIWGTQGFAVGLKGKAMEGLRRVQFPPGFSTQGDYVNPCPLAPHLGLSTAGSDARATARENPHP
jgi:hypothetical protein